jgi:dTDP-glucose 4,6-dehydratase
MKVVYVTGCLGFIGMHVTQMCLDRGWHVIGVDKCTYASNTWALDQFQQHANFLWLPQDINDLERLHDCDYVINVAAETHVDNSIVSSDAFLRSNVNGVHNLLKLIMTRQGFRMPTLLHFSTDEVYGDIESGSHVETDLLRPSNPYAATKAAADMLIMAWNRTFGVPYVIVRPTNNYGVGQYVEKLIPKSVKHLTLDRPIDIHDRGEPRRTWLHVSDTVQAISTIIDAGVINEIYNISGNCELPNREVVQKILSIYHGRSISHDWEQYITEGRRLGQDVRYSIDDSKLRDLGWQCQAEFDQELDTIVTWYRNNFVW